MGNYAEKGGDNYYVFFTDTVKWSSSCGAILHLPKNDANEPSSSTSNPLQLHFGDYKEYIYITFILERRLHSLMFICLDLTMV